MSEALKRALAMLALGFLAWSMPARADDVVKAGEAYERGARASKGGDFATAAKEFARADELAPSPTALEAALDAAVQADDPALGVELLERSKRAPVTGPLSQSVSAAHAKFDGRGGHMRVVCTHPPCKVEVDGKPVDPQKPIWAPKGTHAVVREDATGAKTSMLATVTPDSTIDVDAPAAASPTPPPPSKDERGGKLPKYVFYAGAGLTVAAGVVTVVFGLDSNGTHDDFEKAGCTRGASPLATCNSLRDDGQGAETRTNIALLSTVVIGAAVAVIGVFFTDWNRF